MTQLAAQAGKKTRWSFGRFWRRELPQQTPLMAAYQKAERYYSPGSRLEALEAFVNATKSMGAEEIFPQNTLSLLVDAAMQLGSVHQESIAEALEKWRVQVSQGDRFVSGKGTLREVDCVLQNISEPYSHGLERLGGCSTAVKTALAGLALQYKTTENGLITAPVIRTVTALGTDSQIKTLDQLIQLNVDDAMAMYGKVAGKCSLGQFKGIIHELGNTARYGNLKVELTGLLNDLYHVDMMARTDERIRNCAETGRGAGMLGRLVSMHPNLVAETQYVKAIERRQANIRGVDLGDEI